MWSKSIFASKTFWLNAVAFIIGMLALLADQPWLPPNVVLVITTTVVPFLNMLLRFFSQETPLHLVNPTFVRRDDMRP